MLRTLVILLYNEGKIKSAMTHGRYDVPMMKEMQAIDGRMPYHLVAVPLRRALE